MEPPAQAELVSAGPAVTWLWGVGSCTPALCFSVPLLQGPGQVARRPDLGKDLSGR